MSLGIGTLVKPWNSDTSTTSCKGGACVGKVLKFVTPPTQPITDDSPATTYAVVEWYEQCNQHYRTEKVARVGGWFKQDTLLQIGQI